MASRILIPIALSLLSVSAAAQDVQTHPRYYPVSGPLQRIVYDLDTREITRIGTAGRDGRRIGPEEVGRAEAVAYCFRNTNTMGYFSVGDVGTEWRDWAGKGTGKSGVVRRFFFSYATSANSTVCGGCPPGAGANIEIAFYTGETGFCTNSGVEVPKSRFCFTGLPAISGTLGSASGAGFAVTAFAPSKTFCLPDGKIGWSYGFKGPDDGSGEARTGPLMTSFVTANTCAADAFDLYTDRPSSDGTCEGSFFFGGCEPLPQPVAPIGIPCASFHIGIGEDDGSDLASAIFHDPKSCNAATFATDSGPVIGETWQSTVSPVSHQVCVLRVTSGACGGGLKPGNLNGTALYAVAPVLTQQTSAGCGPGSHGWALPVQKNLNLVAKPFCGQSIGVDTGPVTIFGENAENLVVGTAE